MRVKQVQDSNALPQDIVLKIGKETGKHLTNIFHSKKGGIKGQMRNDSENL